MYVSSIICDCWQGSESDNIVIDNPSWEQIETAVRNLDGERRTIVSLQGEAEAHLVVSGGSLGRYVVYATYDNENFFSLCSINENASPVLLNVGGQDGDYPSKIVVELPAALAAANDFADFGRMDATQRWLAK